MSRVTVTLTAAIAGGQTFSASSGVIDAEATGQIDVDLTADDSTVTVDIQPSAASQIHVLMISSTHYSSNLTYVFSDGSSDAADTLTLDGPHSYSAGNLGAVGVKPTQIKFTLASGGDDATVSIFVARDATP
ncbi:MAG TPA: hypothetical protein ENI97_15000 [Gammaproteobacteria bacterium]|nr:hypothetical protein [Gammaproteobacteria bacterium]